LAALDSTRSPGPIQQKFGSTEKTGAGSAPVEGAEDYLAAEPEMVIGGHDVSQPVHRHAP